jgi:tetratricopeptide (TPR) repeat protein
MVEVDTSSQKWAESRGYSIHGCVHSWTIHILNQEWDYDLARLALKFVGLHILGTERIEWWLIQRRLLQHAARCSYTVLNHMVIDDGMEWAFYHLARLYEDQGKLDEAEKMYQRALQGYEKAGGPDHTSTLATVHNLGNLYRSQGKQDQAENMHQRALQGKDKKFNRDFDGQLGGEPPAEARAVILIVDIALIKRGWNIQAVDEIIFWNIPWTYSAALETITRAYRGGQLHKVWVWYLVNVGNELEKKLMISLDNVSAITDYSLEMMAGDVEGFRKALWGVAKKTEVISIDKE